VIQQVLNTTTQAWVNASRDTYTHDTSDFLTQRLLESWVPSFSTWINNYRWTFTHDAFNNLTSVLEENWDPVGSVWRNASRTTIYVKATGLIDSLVTDSWSQGPQVWIPETRSIFIYSADGLVYNKRDQVFDNSSQTWLDSYLTLYTYFYSGPLIKTITGEFWKPTTFNWIKNSIYRNDSAGHNTEVYKKYWDPGTYEFTGGYRYAWEFDATGNNTRLLSQNYDPGIATWANNSQDLYAYDAESHLMEDLYQLWNIGLDDWVNSRKYVYFYNEFIGIGEIPQDKPCFHANPLRAGSPVTCPFFSAGSTYDLSMYSVSGALVYSETFAGGKTILIGNGLPEGMYLLSIRSGGKEVYRDKVILVK
jgi:hypothetical protein